MSYKVPAFFSLLLVATICPFVRVQADEPSNQSERIKLLETRVSQLEAELKTIRREFAALNAALRESAARLARPSRPSNSLEIQVLEGGWGDASVADIRAVCRSAAQELWQHFPGQEIDPISIRFAKEGPMVAFGKGSSGERRVLLDVQGTLWARFSYQFAHEFCHVLCDYREAKNPNLWFEESLCETASLFAMRRMAETWKTKPPYPNWKSYSSSLASYADNRLKATKQLEEMTLGQWYREHEESLRKTATDREKNQMVAVALLPLLEKNPQHWQAVRHLNQWDKTQPLAFEAYLADWYRRVPEQHKPFVAEVASLFDLSLGR
jgi:hypothetical protein